jgi:hypothetical protein
MSTAQSYTTINPSPNLTPRRNRSVEQRRQQSQRRSLRTARPPSPYEDVCSVREVTSVGLTGPSPPLRHYARPFPSQTTAQGTTRPRATAAGLGTESRVAPACIGEDETPGTVDVECHLYFLSAAAADPGPISSIRKLICLCYFTGPVDWLAMEMQCCHASLSSLDRLDGSF